MIHFLKRSGGIVLVFLLLMVLIFSDSIIKVYQDISNGLTEQTSASEPQQLPAVTIFQLVDGNSSTEFELFNLTPDVELQAGMPVFLYVINSGNQVHSIEILTEDTQHSVYEAELGPGNGHEILSIISEGEYVVTSNIAKEPILYRFSVDSNS